MFQTILDTYDVFRTDLQYCEKPCREKNGQVFSTNPYDYLSDNGFYL